MWLIHILSVHTHVYLQAALGLPEALCVNLTQRLPICWNGLCFVKAINTLALKMAWLSPTRMFLAGSKGMSSYGQLMAKGQGFSLSIFPWKESRALLDFALLWTSVSLPVSKRKTLGDPPRDSQTDRLLDPQRKVIGSSCHWGEHGGLQEWVTRLPPAADTAPWFMSNCQAQSRFPPGQARLQWSSGEVACPAAVFTVLRRVRESDPGREGWAAPLGPPCPHSFPGD